MTVAFEFVGIFGARPGGGSPLAVVHEADGLDPEDMHWIAARLRADETAFVLRPTKAGATHRVRVFHSGGESPFGGHSAIGTAVSLVRAGRLPAGEVVQECGDRLLPLCATAEWATVSVSAPQSCRPLPAHPLLEALGLTPDALAGEPALAGFGPLFHLLPVSPEAVTAAQPDFAAMARAELPALCLFAWDAVARVATARLFAPGYAIPEDPACGPVGLALAARLGADCPRGSSLRFTIEQGAELGRPARLDCTAVVDDDGLLTATVGGGAPRELAGELTIDRTRKEVRLC